MNAARTEIPSVHICVKVTKKAPIPKRPVCAGPASYKKHIVRVGWGGGVGWERLIKDWEWSRDIMDEAGDFCLSY